MNGPVSTCRSSPIGSCRGDPNNVDIAAATAKRHPRAAGARAATPTPSPRSRSRCCSPSTAASCRADRRRARRARCTATARSPTSATGRGSSRVAPRGSSASARSAARLKWRLEGLGMTVIALRPLRRRRDALARRPARRVRRRLDARRGHARDAEHLIGADQFARMKDGAIFVNTARAMLHDTDALVAALRVGQARRRGPRPLRRRAPPDRPPAHRHDERRAHPAHRRRDLRHRGEPLHASSPTGSRQLLGGRTSPTTS